MVPIFGPGDALFINKSSRVFYAGQIVAYRSHKDPRQIISHRVIAVDMKSQILTTKGDNLSEADPPIRTWDVMGSISYIIPKAGYVISFMLSWPGLISIVYIPAAVILGLEVRRVCLRSKTSFYYRQ
jgi:signal peptidase I